MAVPSSTPPAPSGTLHPPMLGRVRTTVLLVMLGTLIACLVFSWTTRDAMEHLPFLRNTASGRLASSQNSLVDLRPWQTASALAPLAVSNEEAEFAQDAERLADHEVDQAFASALREATVRVQHSVLTGNALALSQRVSQLQALVKSDKDQVNLFSPSTANPNKSNDGSLVQDTQDDLDIAKAQLGLDTDQLNDAQEDLARASGDDRAQIQSELQEHEAAMKSYDSGQTAGKQVAVLSAKSYATLSALVGAWNSQRSRYGLIQQAQQQAQADVATLTAAHNALQTKANAVSQPGLAPDSADHATRLASIKERGAQRQLLSIYDDRIQTEQQLATVYGKWASQVLLQHRIVMHLILGSLSWIAIIVIVMLLCDALLVRLMAWPNLDRRQMLTLRAVSRLSLQILGVLLVALVVFGSPQQMPTILGLATAGLTVVLQDFILAFFGWFVLMGKHGIHVGDWVEINGVGGEVTEIGLFRTTLLETGNWTDTGHPTGRRVTFINSFAIRGQFFNFSTSGQWMWDELSVSVPAGEDTYSMIEDIHKTVIEATEKDAVIAEQEWKRGSRSDGLGQFTAEATVNVRPSGSGVDVLVRYVTRASERAEMRNRLFQRVLDVLRQPGPSGK
ncbi:Small-conductance mechanosensitive channel [Bryocella elongata]|uniref:Small-conductance mechanosensitive channel n=1 Tax=Bryocella elongata TaxID=863522 RepID=A0A1H5UNX4_9BACT|nr:mechanosensitive ion channel domain-containing protein [Bryocella elongata]SEF76720.1 Small-conductance mechanosensitive channel [Bryocella elongata]